MIKITSTRQACMSANFGYPPRALGPTYGKGTGPRAGFLRTLDRLPIEHETAHHSGLQTTAPAKGTRSERRRARKAGA